LIADNPQERLKENGNIEARSLTVSRKGYSRDTFYV
jgi:hypothetical protein